MMAFVKKTHGTAIIQVDSEFLINLLNCNRTSYWPSTLTGGKPR